MKQLVHKLDGDIAIFVVLVFAKVILTHWFISKTITAGVIFFTLGFVLMLSSFSYLLSLRARRLSLLLFNLLISILLFADLLYVNYFGEPISLHVIYQVNNVSGLGPSIISLMEWKHLFLFLDFLACPFLFHLGKAFNHPIAMMKRFALLFITSILFLSIIPIQSVYSDHEEFKEEVDEISLEEQLGPIGHHVLDTYYYIKDGQNVDLTEEEETLIKEWYKHKNEAANLQLDSPYRSIGEGKNLIMIQVESLQNFVINMEINGQEVTPNLNRMLAKSLYFPNFYPQTAEGNSSDAELLMNTSLYPIREGSTFFRFPENDYISLGGLLKEKGYETAMFHADEGDYWNRINVYPKLGFEQFFDITSYQFDEEIGMGLSDGSMFQQTIGKIKSMKQPFYSFIITLSSHMPFELPEHLRKLSLPDEMEDTLIGNYLQSIHYTDETIGAFMEQLKAEGLLENTIIVIYGDHAGIHKKDQEILETVLTKQPITTEEWLRRFAPVPFIIYHPSLEGKSFANVGGQIDGFPTIASIMGIEDPRLMDAAMGQNMLERKEGFAILPSGDYADSAYITDTQISLALTEEQEKTLMISDLLIRSNYFKQSQSEMKEDDRK